MQDEQPLVLPHRRAQQLREVGATAARACAVRTARAPRSAWRRLNSGSVSGVIVYSTPSVATDSRIASYSLRAHRDPHRSACTAARGAIDGRPQRRLDHRRVRSERGPVQQLLADVPRRSRCRRR